jgi:hypothetical protein
MQPEKYSLDLSNNSINNIDNNNQKKDTDEIIIPFWINDPNVLFQQQCDH